MKISVIICTHNPRPDYLRRVLDALQAQTLPKEQWELLLIDNASKEALDKSWDLSWHPSARHIHEEELGLTPARLRGIKESTGELLVFVDDDNVLAVDYLSIAVAIAEQWPMLGAWAGQSIPEFETSPGDAIRPFLGLIGDGKFQEDYWSNLRNPEATPSGCGMCIRRKVAEEYHTLATTDERRRRLDRCGKSLISGGDTDMAFTACDLGLGTGRFHRLKLTHLISSRRLKLSYLLPLQEAMSFSWIILDFFRNPDAARVSTGRWLINYLRAYTSRGLKRRFRLASLRGQAAARRTLKHQSIL
jgi:glycosyltransferase involved in cell wall biosynthesis